MPQEPYNADVAVSNAIAKRTKEVLAELDTHRQRIDYLTDELFALRQQSQCSPHDWVNECSGLPCNIDKCTKCGATNAY